MAQQSRRQKAARRDWVSAMRLVILIGTGIIAIVIGGVVRIRKGRAAIQTTLNRDGYSVVTMQYRVFRQGPLFWTTTRSQIVYRVLVCDGEGRQHILWARWGRSWLPERDRVDLRWNDGTAYSR